jgi:hypothetical protein
LRSVLVIAIEAEHKKPNGRRQVWALPIFVNAGDKLPQGLAPILRDLSQARAEKPATIAILRFKPAFLAFSRPRISLPGSR